MNLWIFKAHYESGTEAQMLNYYIRENPINIITRE